MTTYSGKYVGNDRKIGIVVARFNNFVTDQLLAGAQDSLLRHGVDPADVDVVWVPGAFEIPTLAKQLAASGRYDGVIALGAVIRGQLAITTTFVARLVGVSLKSD